MPERYEWYSWGSGGGGHLAHGDTADYSSPRLITTPPFSTALSGCTASASSSSSSEPTVATLACSGLHTLICTADGALYSCGTSAAPPHAVTSLPQAVSLQQPVRAVACGWSHFGCITQSGQLFMWGSNSHRQLGLQPPAANAAVVSSPARVELRQPVVSLSCGRRHTLALTSGHQLLGWGSNRHHQLVTASSTVATASTAASPRSALVATPSALPLPALPVSSPVVAALCGHQFSVCLTADGSVFCCGDNRYGQCGRGAGEAGGAAVVEDWRRLCGLQAVEQLSCGWSHCLARDRQGRVWMWGKQTMGQGGRGRQAAAADSSSSGAVHEIALPLRARSVHCGSESCLVVDEECGLWSWGWNEHGNVGGAAGDGDDDGRCVWRPRRVQLGADRLRRDELRRVIAVDAACASVFVCVAAADV